MNCFYVVTNKDLLEYIVKERLLAIKETWNEMMCAHVAESGQLNLLKWLKYQGCPWNETTCSYAAYGYHLDVLQWAREQGCPWNEFTCGHAARKGYLNILQWAMGNGCPISEWTCAEAAIGGQLDILKYLRSLTPPCPWDQGMCLHYSKALKHKGLFAWASEQT